MLLAGVGHIFTAVCRFNPPCLPCVPAPVEQLLCGVGHNPDPIPPVRGTNGARGYTMPLRIVPERSERPEYLIQSARAKGGDIFDEDVARLERVDRFGVLEPEAATFSTESGAFPGETDVLTGESAAQEINGFDG